MSRCASGSRKPGMPIGPGNLERARSVLRVFDLFWSSRPSFWLFPTCAFLCPFPGLSPWTGPLGQGSPVVPSMRVPLWFPWTGFPYGPLRKGSPMVPLDSDPLIPSERVPIWSPQKGLPYGLTRPTGLMCPFGPSAHLAHLAHSAHLTRLPTQEDSWCL